MVSRILLLLLIDMLAVGVSLNRSSPFAELQRQAKRGILTHTAPAPIAGANDDEAEEAEEAVAAAPMISHTK